MPSTLAFTAQSPYRRLIGVGGIGTGLFFALEGPHTLGRNESRPARLLNVRDYGKLHIIAHYIAVLLGPTRDGSPFHVVPIGKVGDDDAGRRMIQEMQVAGMDTRHVQTVPDLPTMFSVCFQYPDGSGGNITTSESAASALTPQDVYRCASLLAEDGAHTMVLAAPEVPLETRDHLLMLAGKQRAFRAASFTSAEIEEAHRRGMFSRLDLVAMNEDEAGTLISASFEPANPTPFLSECGRTLEASQPRIQIIVSAGKQGAYAYSAGMWFHRTALDVPVVSTAGAGDALLAGVLSGLAVGMPLVKADSTLVAAGSGNPESAFDLGVLLAAYSVTSPHTIHPDANLESVTGFARDLTNSP